ncbi:MAG: outer membrane lipoprotein-sorting protein [Verrucomicrobiota bacterium]|nr:outer membrane lipoprotein-sorting protein [Verrucomicrobiota bacterium]MCC6820549.1 outer membrane lipoprotein-sorting protein [Limisphaerales bacterium]
MKNETGRAGWPFFDFAFCILQLSTLAVTASLDAATTNDSATAEREGRQLAHQLCDLRPEANLTNTGKLVLRIPKQQRQEIPFSSRILLTETNWTTAYEAIPDTNGPVTFRVEHRAKTPNLYFVTGATLVPNDQTMTPFAGSDFWLADLGLEFFHWPAQRLWKREMRRGKSCHVLESRRPESWTNGYARVVSWIHTESGAIVQAEAYDPRGKLLKEFRPTAVEKVNGAWQLKEMEIENVQTGSRTTLVFDLQPE